MGRRCLDRRTLLFTALGTAHGRSSRQSDGTSANAPGVAQTSCGRPGPLGDTVEDAPAWLLQRRLLKALPVAASLFGIVFAIAAAAPLDGVAGAPVTQSAAIIVTAAVPAPTTTTMQLPVPSSPSVDVPSEPPPVAAKMKCPPTAARVASRPRVASVNPKPPAVAVVQSEQTDPRVAQVMVDGRYIRTAL